MMGLISSRIEKKYNQTYTYPSNSISETASSSLILKPTIKISSNAENCNTAKFIKVHLPKPLNAKSSRQISVLKYLFYKKHSQYVTYFDKKLGYNETNFPKIHAFRNERSIAYLLALKKIHDKEFTEEQFIKSVKIIDELALKTSKDNLIRINCKIPFGMCITLKLRLY